MKHKATGKSFVAEAAISLPKSQWDNDLATSYGVRVSLGVSEVVLPPVLRTANEPRHPLERVPGAGHLEGADDDARVPGDGAHGSLDEVLGFRPDFIEHQLAHAVREPNGRVYNRTAFLPKRRVMMQAWADYLDRLRVGEIEPGPHFRHHQEWRVQVLAVDEPLWLRW